MRLIDGDALIKKIEEQLSEQERMMKVCKIAGDTKNYYDISKVNTGMISCMRLLKSTPTIELQIVRCKDCKHQNWVNQETGRVVCKIAGRGSNAPDWFCADGERR